MTKTQYSKDTFEILYDWPDLNLLKLKQFIDNIISKGYIDAEIEIVWSPYDDVDAVTIKPYKKE